MNKYSLKEFLEKKLEKYSSTLKNTSFDDTNKRYLCTDESTKNVYDFDEYIESNSIKFGLQELNKEYGNFYDEIITRDINFYKKEFKNLKCS